MNDKRDALADDRKHLIDTAFCMRVHADAALDGAHAVPGIPETWAYALLAMAGWLETEAEVFNARTRPYALAAANSFIWGDGGIA